VLKILFKEIFFAIILIILIFQIGLVTKFDKSSAVEASLPEWIWTVYNFWFDGKITDEELINFIKFLEERNIIELIMHKNYDTRTNFLFSIIQIEKQETRQKLLSCDSGWYFTGYFTPVESDYSKKLVNIFVDNTMKQYRADFINDVRIEGWGRTLQGDYLGWYNNEYHLGSMPLDYFGNRLEVGTVAVDPLIIKPKSELYSPSLQSPWDSLVFLATDSGPGVKGKHIDVFTGEGLEAKFETNKITSYDNEVCIKQ